MFDAVLYAYSALRPKSFVGEAFTGIAGKFVPREETVRSFGEVLAGKYDDLPEQAFYMVGNIEEAREPLRRA